MFCFRYRCRIIFGTALFLSFAFLSVAMPVKRDGKFIGPPGPGQPTALAQASSQPNIVYAAYRRIGVLRSFDGGRSFNVVVQTALSSYTVTCLAVHPVNQDIVIAGATTPYDQFNRQHAALLRSLDGGANWSLLYQSGYSVDIPAVADVAFDPANPDIILAGLVTNGWLWWPPYGYTESPLLRTIDGGNNWYYVGQSALNNTRGGQAAITAISFDPNTPGRALAGTAGADSRFNNGLWQSTDSGLTWTQITGSPFPGPASAPRPIFDLGWNSDGTRLYAATVAELFGAFRTPIYSSSDGGLTWAAASPAVTNFSEQIPNTVFKLAFSPDNPDVVYASSGVLQHMPGYHSADYSNIPLFKTTNAGATWTSSTSGLVTGLAFPPNNANASIQGIVTGTAGAPEIVVAIPATGLQTRESGGAFEILPTASGAKALVSAMVGPQQMLGGLSLTLPNTSALMSGSGSGMGWTWTPVAIGAAKSVTHLLANSVSPANVLGIFTGALYASSNAGQAWDSLNFKATVIASPPGNSQRVFIGQEPGLLRSDDFGQTSATVGTGLGLAYPAGIAFGPSASTVVVAARNFDPALGAGVYVSYDDGNNFSKQNNGLPSDTSIEHLFWTGGSTQKILGFSSRSLGTASPPGSTWQFEPVRVSTPQGTATAPYIMSAAAAVVNNQPILYLTTGAHYFHRSTDLGATWQMVNPSPTGFSSIFGIYVNPAHQSHAWIDSYKWLYRTTDGGETWTTTSRPILNYRSDAMATDPSDVNTLYFAEYESLFVTRNGGVSWTPVPLNSDIRYERISSIAVSPTSPNTILIGTGRKIYITTNGGTHWSPWTLPNIGWDDVEQIVFAPSDPSRVYAYSSSDRRFLRSVDGGLSWSIASKYGFFQYSHYGENRIAVSPTNANEVLMSVSSDTVYRSTNAGGTWDRISPDLDNVYVNSVATNASQPGVILAGLGAGIYKTIDAGFNWSKKLTNNWNFPVNHIVANPAHDTEYLAATDWGLLYSGDTGETWKQFAPALEGAKVKHLQLVQGAEGMDVIASTEEAGIWSTQLFDWQADVAISQSVTSEPPERGRCN